MEDRLANELLDAMNNTGASAKKKEDMHKIDVYKRQRHDRSGNHGEYRLWRDRYALHH